MILVMYPLQTQIDHEDLRYSLRSLKFIDHSEVLIIGSHIPDWLTNVTWINVKDDKGRKQLNIKRKIAAALGYAEKVFCFNDDIYLLQTTDPETFPYYSTGLLKSIGESGARPLREKLEQLGRPTINYDGHFPILYDRIFLDIMMQFPADTIIKSAYCNMIDVQGKEMADCKINKKMGAEYIKKLIGGRPCFSTGPQGLGSCLGVLRELFSEPSIYEV